MSEPSKQSESNTNKQTSEEPQKESQENTKSKKFEKWSNKLKQELRKLGDMIGQ